MAPVPDAPIDSVLDRLQSFVSDNKRVLLIGAAAAAVAAGAVYYASASSSRPGKKDGKRKRKDGKDSKRFGDSDGPILEERKPRVSVVDEGA
jgi:import receptor subunit TOM70